MLSTPGQNKLSADLKPTKSVSREAQGSTPPQPAPPASTGQIAAPGPLPSDVNVVAFGTTTRNRDVVRLVRRGASVAEIVNTINSSEPGYTLYEEDVRALQKDDVPEIVIRAMRMRQTGGRLQIRSTSNSAPATSQASTVVGTPKSVARRGCRANHSPPHPPLFPPQGNRQTSGHKNRRRPRSLTLAEELPEGTSQFAATSRP